MRCFIIARQSVGDNDESLSIDSQIAECRKLCDTENISVIDEFADYNTSGRLYPIGFEEVSKMDLTYQRWITETGKKTFRVGLGNALKRLKEVDYLVCYDITRLHRSLNGSFLASIISQQLIANHVKVWTIKEGQLDFTKFTDSLITNLTSQINSEQLMIQKEKSMASVKRLKDAGEWNVQCFKSFGYKSTGKKREVEVDEFKADVVKEVYRRYINGESYYTICHAVNARLYERTGKNLFKTHMFRILRNPIYCGYYKDSKGELVKAKPIIGKEIISFDTWKTAQEIYNNRVIHPKRAYKNWLPLSGKVFCGECNEVMPAITANKYFVQYRCMSYSKHGYNKEHSCRNGISWNAKIPAEGGDYLKEALFGLLPIYYINKLRIASTDSTLDDEKREANVAIHNLKKRLSNVNQAYMDGLMEDDEYSRMLKNLNEKLKEANGRLNELNDMKKPDDYSTSDLLCDLEQLDDGEIEQSELEEAFRYVFKRVTIFKDHVDVVTPLGLITLPINRVWRSKLMPLHKFIVCKNTIQVVYYWKTFEDESLWRSIASFDGIEFHISE